MANTIDNEIEIRLKSRPESGRAAQFLYDTEFKKLNQFILKCEADLEFEEQALREFRQDFDDADNKYLIHFESKAVEVKDFSDRIFNDFDKAVKSLIHIFTDRDGQEYGGMYYYLGGMFKKFNVDLDYFEDLNWWLDDNEIEEPQLDDYFYTEESKYESQIEIRLNGDPDKLNKLLKHVDNNCKWEDSIVFDFKYSYDEEDKKYLIKYYSLDTAAINLAQQLFLYSYSAIEELIHIFSVKTDFGKKMFYKDKTIKVFELNGEYFDDLQEYKDSFNVANTTDDLEKVNRPDINDYFEEKEEIQLLK